MLQAMLFTLLAIKWRRTTLYAITLFNTDMNVHGGRNRQREQACEMLGGREVWKPNPSH